ncbi:MAG: CheR family methyltransferase [Cyanobacteriota bacterium]
MNTPEVDQEFEALLDYLKCRRGCDLTGYKRSTLMRRFQHRMQEVGIENYGDYLHYLQRYDQEWVTLFNTITINVTAFFRDRDAWDYLANQIIPQIINSKQPHEQIRVWSAGCASGQELYTLAILLAQALGIKQYLQRVQIFATDIDEDALNRSRRATYSDLEVAAIPPNLLEKYFEQTEQGYVFNAELLRRIIFGRHNLAKDAPMSKIDLLTCRNTLMYFNTEMQASILVRFHFALKPNGFLFLGNAETIVTHRQIFTPVNFKHRVFAKGLKLSLDDHLQIIPQTRKKKAVDPLATQIHIWQAAFDMSPFAQLVVDLNACLVMANAQANALFGLTNSDLGRSFQDLALGRLISSHTDIHQLFDKRCPVSLKYVEWATSQDTTYLDIHITPISAPSGSLLGASLTVLSSKQPFQLNVSQHS